MSGEFSSSFKFSLAVGEATEKDIDLQIAALEARLDKLVRKCEVTDSDGQHIPLLGWILKVARDKEQLTTLGKALPRAAEIVEQLDELRTQKTIYTLAKKNPSRLQWMFGDFSSDVDELTTNLERLTKDA